VKGNLGQYLTVLGLCSLVFYGVMLATGHLGTRQMPQFVITAVIFLTAGRMTRKIRLGEEEDESEEEQAQRQTDWDWLTALLNWTAVILLIAVMAILLMKPADLSLKDAFNFSTAHRSFFAGAVP